MIYLDHAATTPTHPDVITAMTSAMHENWGNPSSIHTAGQKSRMALDTARDHIAKILEIEPKEIIFCASGSEADNLAVFGITEVQKSGHIITSAAEHHAILDTMKKLDQNDNFEVTFLKPDNFGRISRTQVEKEIRNDTILVSIMLVNNELGTITDTKPIGRLCEEKNIPFHTDAICAAGGGHEIRPKYLKATMMTIAAHKFGGPKGIGLLFVDQKYQLSPQTLGGGQERNRRAGTENLPAIIGLQKALEIRQKTDFTKIKTLRDNLETKLTKNIPKITINCNEPRLPGHLHISFDNIDSESLLIRLDIAEICTSSGSACSAGAMEPSHVLIACGFSRQKMRGSLRLTLGTENTQKEIDEATKKITEIVKDLRQK